MMITVSARKQTKYLDKYTRKPIQTHQVISWKTNKHWRHFPLSKADLIGFHCIHYKKLSQQHHRHGETLPTPVEKDEGDALFKVWAHEPLKGLFMPLPAWIITPSFPVMCCGWYIGPHLLLLRFHLARSSKSSINKKNPGRQQDFCTAKDYRLRSTVKTAWPIW